MIQEIYGIETWTKIIKKSGMDDWEDFQMMKAYTDAATFRLFQVITDALGLDVSVFLEKFGQFFFKYVTRMNFGPMIRSLGDDLVSFIVNLDSLHNLLQMTYTDMIPPSFLAECTNSELTVSYTSTRKGLHFVAMGILKAVAAEIYNQQVEIRALRGKNDFSGSTAYVEQVLLEIRLVGNSVPLPLQSTEDETASFLKECVGPELLLSNAHLINLLPYHLVLNRQLIIVQCGRKLRQFNQGIRAGASFSDVFSIANPIVEAEFSQIQRFINSAYTLAFHRLDMLSEDNNEPKELRVKGQMRYFSESDHLVFLGSLRVANLDQMQADNLYMSDIPMFDVTRELITINQQQKADHTINKKLNEATTQLSKLTLALEAEKQKTDNLLFQMLPKRVAESLRNGERVDAEKYSLVTVLFSDIVGFTDICSGSLPEQVVAMLNSIFTIFDQHTEVHQVYKVETIGDAYMVVGGCPDRVEDHAQRVADQGLDMVASSKLVRAAGSDSKIQIRVGMHSGPVVTGVVGEKMPRFCLFGDTVNTASRMESHGCPGLVHMSESSYTLLKSTHATEPRGKIYVKGKGEMRTYFLLGRVDSDISGTRESAAAWKNVQTQDEHKPDMPIPKKINAAAEPQSGRSTETRVCQVL